MAFTLNRIVHYLIFLIILISVGILYSRYMKTDEKYAREENMRLIRRYLLNESPLAASKKPIIWIHVQNEVNARNWLVSTGNTRGLNQPYLHLTIGSIIKHCGGSFNVCLIDDNSFSKLLPDWEVNVEVLPSPMKEHTRQLAMAKLLYRYGGIIVPASFACFTDLTQLKSQMPFVGLCRNRGMNNSMDSGRKTFFPSTDFMGAEKEDPEILKLVSMLQVNNSRDFTGGESDFVGKTGIWLYNEIGAGRISGLDAKIIGCADSSGEAILLDDLMSSKHIDLSTDAVGVYIPADELLLRRTYGWFVRMSEEQVTQNPSAAARFITEASAM